MSASVPNAPFVFKPRPRPTLLFSHVSPTPTLCWAPLGWTQEPKSTIELHAVLLPPFLCLGSLGNIDPSRSPLGHDNMPPFYWALLWDKLCLHAPNSYIEAPIPNMTIFGDGGSFDRY